MHERCERIYELQADDTGRFDVAAGDLVARLDGSVGSITAMTCDHRFVPLFENWVEGCDRAGLKVRDSTMVFPIDREAFDRIETLGFVAHFDDESELLGGMRESVSYGDLAWVDYMYHQNWVIERLLSLDGSADLLFQDVDVVWRRDPRPALREQAERGADIQAMYDGPNPRFQPIYANGGFVYFRNAEPVRAFWADVYDRHEMVGYYRSQQEPLNVMLAVYATRGLEVQVLDEERFANGHLYCGGRTPPPDPWVVHHSWTGTLADKLDRYVESELWYLGDDVLEEMRAQELAPADPSPAPTAPVAAPPATAATPAEAALLELLVYTRRERDRLQEALDAMRRSTSWRVTAPVRRLKDRVARRGL